MIDLPRILLVLSATLLLMMTAATLVYDTAWSRPEPHARIPAMEVGGQRAVEDANHWGLGLAFGVVMILLFTASLLMAAEDSSDRTTLRAAICAGSVLFIVVFVVMMASYREYAFAKEQTLLGPFPAPTTWMVFGVWAAPAIFTAIYCIGFHKWFSADEDEDAATPDRTIGSGAGDAN